MFYIFKCKNDLKLNHKMQINEKSELFEVLVY